MERISGRQLILIGALFTLDSTLVSVTGQATKYGKQHVYMSLLIAFLIVFFAIKMLSSVMKRYPNKDLFQIMIDRRPVLGRIIGVMYILFFFLILTRDIRMVVDFAIISLLPNTPIAVIAGLIVFTVIVIARGGIEIPARMSEIWGPILFLVIIMIPVMLFKEFDKTFIMPYLDVDVLGILQGAWFILPYFGEIIGVFLLFSTKEYKFKYVWLGLLIGSFMILLLTMSSILILGSQLTGRMMYPVYETIRQLRVTDFLDRFDLPLVGIWFPTLLTKIALGLYIVCHGMKRIFPSITVKAIISPFGFLSFSCSIWFYHNAMQIYVFNETWPALGLIFQLFIPILLYFILRPKKKDGKLRTGNKQDVENTT